MTTSLATIGIDRTSAEWDWTAAFAARAAGMKASEIRELLKLLDQPGIISFAGGIPDPDLFPVTEISAVIDEVLSDLKLAGDALQYSVTEGYRPLREWVVAHMGRLGVPCSLENVLITTGSQQALDLLAKVLLHPGDTALVARPTYLGALQAFRAYEPSFADIAMLLEDKLLPGAEPLRGLAYVVAEHSNPSGGSLPLACREMLLERLAEGCLPLIEDAAYQALRYQGEPLPSLLELDIARTGWIDSSRVAYCGSFSKVIAPGLRVGWLCASRDLVSQVVLAKQATDLHSSSLNQMILSRVVERCFDQQVARLSAAYGARRDAMLKGLALHMPSGVSWSEPDGGMFVWLTLPASVDASELLGFALHEEQIAFVPGGAFFFDGSGHNHLRLNFSLQSESDIHTGMAALGRLLRRHIG